MTEKKNEDSGLVDRFKQGDAFAFEEIVLRYQDRIYNVCRSILDDQHDAETERFQGTNLNSNRLNK